MNPVKRYVLAMGTLLLVTLIASVIVWYVYQRVESTQSEILNHTTPSPDHVELAEKAPSPTTTPDATPLAAPPRVLTAESLSPSQQKILESFGMGDAKVVITEATIQCAKSAVGETRLDELLKGGAPTPFEALALLPCLRK